MKFLSLDQGSQSWLNFRRLHVSGTDAACCLGLNPFKSIEELYYEKMDGTETPVNANMQRGTELEPVARQLIIEATDIEFKPAVGVHDVESWCMASLDGISPSGRFICEIKSPAKVDIHNLAIAGEIKEYYKPQIQHCLFVSGAELCIFCSYFPGHEQELALIEFVPDEGFIADMIEKEKKFYEEHLKEMRPPKEWTLELKR